MNRTVLLVPALCLSLAACATTYATPVEPAAPAAASSGSFETGTMVVRRDLVNVGSRDLLAPVVVPAVPVAEVERSPNVATTSAADSGCEGRPAAVRVHNATEFPVTLSVDGTPVAVLGTGEIRRFVGPRSSAFLCLDPSRPHSFEGFALKPWGDRLLAIQNPF